MGSREAPGRWSVFDGFKFLPAKPDALMAEINTAIAAIEYARATTLLNPSPSSSPSSSSMYKGPMRNTPPTHNARISEEAYRMGCAALAEGKLDEALYCLKTSLSKCPPDKIDAVSKIRSLVRLVSQRLQASSR